MKLFTKLAAAAALITAAQANALTIDFGLTPWTVAGVGGGAHGLSTYTVGNVTATAGPSGALLFADDYWDGLGVYTPNKPGEYDEIDKNETLTLTFASAVSVSAIKLTDFYPKVHGTETNDGSLPSGEYGHISFWLGGIQVGSILDIFGVNSVGTNGEQVLSFANKNVDKIVFWTGGGINDEFSVKSITVPEPGLLGLLGLGLLSLGLSRRRQAKNA
jgi:hypothetical protein